MAEKWICSNDNTHVFEDSINDGWCNICPPYAGILQPKDVQTPQNTNTYSHSSNGIKKGIGLYIFLIDASGSMFDENAFPNVPMKRAKLVSGQVASAIFEMENLSKKDDAYLFVMLFDHRLNAFINFMTVRQVLEQYSDVQTLQSALYKEMESMGQLTDINLALNTALYHAQRFIDGEMDVIGKVEPMVNSVFNPQTGDDKTIPNVRCLIFTDGYQYNEDNYKVKQAGTISGNPFSSFKYNGENVNILMGAFHGEVDNPGFDQLKNVMGKCPVHNLPQFFHFSEASQTMRMKNLFRMGSGPGGFCEKCLDSFMRDYS